MKLEDKVFDLPYIGEKYSKLLEKLQIFTLKDLLYYFPRKYSDTSKIYHFSELTPDEKRTIHATLINIKSIRTRKKITIQKALFDSEGESIYCTWFNQPFLPGMLKINQVYKIYGKLDKKTSDKIALLSPEIEALSLNNIHLGGIIPVYELTYGIKLKWLRNRLFWLLNKIEYITNFNETLPVELIKKYDLNSLEDAIRCIHFPQDELEIQKARFRLGFEELLIIFMKIISEKREREKFVTNIIDIDLTIIDQIKKRLDYKLTIDQESTLNSIVEQMKKNQPLIRLIQGDVGSGKTIIAIIISAIVSNGGYKIAYLAPTSILAEQVYLNFKKILPEKDIKLLTSKTKKGIEINESSIIIGTHALLHQDEKAFSNLQLLIIDEEHRFGVKQREQLFNIEKKLKPHKLTMTATPIPRSLAMTIWGDTEISYIKSKPVKRKEIKTMFVPTSKRAESYKWIKNEIIEKGIQAFWVCPLIEQSDVLDVKSAEETYLELKNAFKDLRIQIVHGKTKDKEQEIQRFKNNEFDILVTTAIIEVGIDIPNSNIIVIESSERFGLAQLHQFRGRVGRGEKQGYCILFGSQGELTLDQKERLKYFCKESNGLEIAKFDLQRRGPGEVYGEKQSGIPNLKIASLYDENLIKKSKEAAEFMINNNLILNT